MPAIHVLPDLLVNKIAAGEVVERPAAVVKELLENALDAGARHVSVAAQDGGKRLIRVSDDGCGMSAEELRLAVAPHATSKLTCEEDLYRIGTLGFRGEALASIGAISHLRIVSRPHDSDEAAEIRVSAEQIESCSAAGAPPGTTIEVRDLFFNTPARRKFLRATTTEMGHISEALSRIALAHPQVGFELISGERVSKRLAADQGRLERIGALYSAELAEELIPIQREERGLTISGYAAPPAVSKASASSQYVFVNGRFIRDRVLNYAIREAYRGLMESNRYPVVFLFLSLDPDQVDVNVHPTKIEVRWQDANLVRSQVLSALRETFLRTDLTPALQAGDRGPVVNQQAQERIRSQIAEELKSLRPESAPSEGTPAFPPGGARQPMRWPSPTGSGNAGRPATPREAENLWRSLFPRPQSGAGRPQPLDAPDRRESVEEGGDEQTLPQPPPDAGPIPIGRKAIQLHNTYLVTETEDGIQIIDQHALHERIMYEQLRRRMTEGQLEAQRLLLPETLEVTQSEAAALQERSDLLERLGIEVTPFGRDAIAVQSFPALLGDADVRGFMRDLIDKLGEPADDPHPEVLIHELLDMMACKAAVKAGDPLTPEEIDALIAHKDLVEKSSNCPHGRPTTLRMRLKDLEKQFKRT